MFCFYQVINTHARNKPVIHIGAFLGFFGYFGALMRYFGALTLVYALGFGLFLTV